MPIQKFTSSVSAIEHVSAQCRVITLQLISPQSIEFKAGQHVIMDIPGIEAKRSYSIASNPKQTDSLDLLIDIRPAGPGSRFLASTKVGDVITFLAPAGQFWCEQWNPDNHIIFIATGSGICPLKSMILHVLGSEIQPRSVHLLWGLRHHRDSFWLDEFEQLKKFFSNFSYDITLSQPSPDSPFLRGRVTDNLHTLTTTTSKGQYYICGSKEMIVSVVEQLNQAGINSESIFFEKFY